MACSPLRPACERSTRPFHRPALFWPDTGILAAKGWQYGWRGFFHGRKSIDAISQGQAGENELKQCRTGQMALPLVQPISAGSQRTGFGVAVSTVCDRFRYIPKRMWEEDPKYQAGNFRFFLGMVVFTTIAFNTWALLTRNWVYLLYFWKIMAGLVGAVTIYIGCIWVFCHTIRLIAHLFRNVFRFKR